MARVRVQLVMVALVVVLSFGSPVTARSSGTTDRRFDIRAFPNRRGWNGVLCVPDVAPLLEAHEGRHKCAYDHAEGFRAIAAGYNLDDDADQRREELKKVGADYDEVYKGESCLNHLQITGLLIADAKRALDRASENVKNLDDFCCSVQAVFADIQHSAGSVDNFPQRDLERFIEKVGREKFRSAARALGKTDWCSREENTVRCDDNKDLVSKGCEID